MTQQINDIQNVATPALLKDTAALASRDSGFKTNLERYFIDHLSLHRRIITGAMLSIMGALMDERPVPWSGEEIVDELRRRKQKK